VTTVLNGGTSASAPMVAAASAVVLQAAKLAGKRLDPADVRRLLEKTGRPVATPPQADRPLNVGNQIDVTAAVNTLLPQGKTTIQRLSVAHRVTTGNLGGDFTEATDPDRIDLQTGGAGEGLVGPITIGADITGAPNRKLDYVLSVNGKQFHADRPAVRITPTQLLQAAGLPVVATADRTVDLTFEVRDGHKVLASAKKTLTVGPTDGTFVEATAPIAPATVKLGAPVTVHYDLTGVRTVKSPQLVVSTVGHWNPLSAPIFSAAHKVPLTGTSATSRFRPAPSTTVVASTASASCRIRPRSGRCTASSPRSASTAGTPITGRAHPPSTLDSTSWRSAGPRRRSR